MIFTNKASCATNDSLERLIFYSEGANLARQSTELSCDLIDLRLCPLQKKTLPLQIIGIQSGYM